MRYTLIALACAAVIGCAAHGEGAQDGGHTSVAADGTDAVRAAHLARADERGGVPERRRDVQVVPERDDARVPVAIIRDLAPGETVKVLRLEQWRALQSHFPEQVVSASRVMWCESKGNPRAVGAAGEAGLLQVHPIHAARARAMGYSWDDMFTVEANVAVASSIYNERGWTAWSCQP